MDLPSLPCASLPWNLLPACSTYLADSYSHWRHINWLLITCTDIKVMQYYVSLMQYFQATLKLNAKVIGIHVQEKLLHTKSDGSW